MPDAYDDWIHGGGDDECSRVKVVYVDCGKPSYRLGPSVAFSRSVVPHENPNMIYEEAALVIPTPQQRRNRVIAFIVLIAVVMAAILIGALWY